jgi:hypothetical protein
LIFDLDKQSLIVLSFGFAVDETFIYRIVN